MLLMLNLCILIHPLSLRRDAQGIHRNTVKPGWVEEIRISL